MLSSLRARVADAYGALTRVVGGLWSRYGGWGWSRVRLLLPGARFDWEREAGDVWMSAIVALAISWLGNRFPRPRIQLAKIARNGDHVPQARSAVVDLWNRPNPHYGRRTLEKAIGLSILTDGNAYLYKVRDNLGRVCQLWWVPHYRILPTWPADGSTYIDGYRVWLDSAQYVLPPEDIIHIRDGIDPRNERLGVAALKSNLREVCTVNYEGSYTAGIMKNSGVPGVMIIPDGPTPPRPDPDGATRMKERFVESFSGDRAGEPLVLAGSYRVVQLGFSPESLQLRDLPRNAEARITASMGVSSMTLGLPDPNKTYSNLGEANRSSWGTIVAIQELVADELRWGLLPEPIAAPSRLTSPGLDPYQYLVEYDYSGIQELQESLDAIHARTREDWKAGVVRLNEAREQLGYEPDPDGDRYYPGTEAAEPAMGTEPDGDEPPADEGQGKGLGNGQARFSL